MRTLWAAKVGEGLGGSGPARSRLVAPPPARGPALLPSSGPERRAASTGRGSVVRRRGSRRGTLERRNPRTGSLAGRSGPSRGSSLALRCARERGTMRGTPRALCSAARAAWRQSFPLDGRDVARWFPGHMAKGEVRARGGRGRLRARVCAVGPRVPAPGSSLAARERFRLRRTAGRAGPRLTASLSPSKALLPLYSPKSHFPRLFLRSNSLDISRTNGSRDSKALCKCIQNSESARSARLCRMPRAPAPAGAGGKKWGDLSEVFEGVPK